MEQIKRKRKKMTTLTNKLIIVILFISVILIAGCNSQNIGIGSTSITKEECIKQGGSWGTVGIAMSESCTLPTSDAGKECTSPSQCEGGCIANLSEEDMQKVEQGIIINATGKCTAWKGGDSGCKARVENGQVNGILCFD